MTETCPKCLSIDINMIMLVYADWIGGPAHYLFQCNKCMKVFEVVRN